MALLEYGLAALPVVCTDVGQCSEVLGNGEYGEVVSAKRSEALAQSIIKFIEDEAYRKKTALKFHRHVKETYSQEAVMHQLVDIYKEALHA